MIELSKLISFVERPISFPVRPGFVLTNASVAVCRDAICAAVPAMDHYLDERGHIIPLPVGTLEDDTRFAQNMTYLVRFTKAFEIATVQAIALPASETPTPPWTFRGFECPRLFTWRAALWISACSSGTGAQPDAEFYRARVSTLISKNRFQRRAIACFSEVQRLGDGKNWMPEVRGDDLRFHYRLGTPVGPDGSAVIARESKYGHLHGGTQVIPYRGDGLGLCIVHEYVTRPGTHLKESRQYFALLGRDGEVQSVSEPFTLTGSALEVATGMAAHPDGERLIISYGRDSTDPLPHQETPFIATVKIAELEKVL